MRIVLVRRGLRALLLLAALAVPPSPAAPLLGYRIVAMHPHDPAAFTEGLVINRGRLIESTGRNGASTVVIRAFPSLRLLKSVRLDDRDFGEGLTVFGDEILQLTWKGGRGYRYDHNLKRLGSFPIASEGWGLTQDGHELIRSDGSATLRLLDPHTFRETRRLQVTDEGRPVERLNELEYVHGRLYANVWLTDLIAVIDPRSGAVTAWLDLSALHSKFALPKDWNEVDNVLNGIAYDAASGHLFVTGKCWPILFELSVEAPPAR